MTRRAIFLVSGKAGPELQGGEVDCCKLQAIFSDPRFGGYDANMSPAPLLNCASQLELITRMLGFFIESDAADQRIVYFTGHGRVSAGDYGFVLKGSKDDFVPFSAITGLLKGKGPGKTVFILDTCHSGAADMAGVKNDGGLPIAPTGSCVLSSSKDIELSHEMQDGGSLFTHYLCECITTGYGGLPTTDGVITVPEAADYVRRRIKEQFATNQIVQTPRYSIHSSESLLWLAHNVSGATVNVAKSGQQRRGDGDRHGNPCAGAALFDLDEQVVRTYANRCLGSDHGALTELADKLDLTVAGSQALPSEAAVLCFGVRPERFFPSAMSMFSSGDRAASAVNRNLISGPLTTQFQQLFSLTTANLRVEARFGVDGLREEDTDIPTVVIREVISNAVAHRTFEGTGRVQVHVADDHVEITNPGKFPPNHSWDDLFEHPGESLPPSRRIANFLEKSGGYEGVGRGFSVLRRYRDERGESAVSFQQRGETVHCRLLRPQVALSILSTDSQQLGYDAALGKFLVASTKALTETVSVSGFSKRYGDPGSQLIAPSLRDDDGRERAYSDFRVRVAKPGCQVLLSGGPVSGKTWLLRRAAIDLAAAAKPRRPRKESAPTGKQTVPSLKQLPVYVPLRSLRGDLPLTEAIAQSSGIDRGAFEHALKRLHCVLLLDGLDEMPASDRPQLLVRVKDLREEFPSTSVVVSTRPTSQSESDFTSFERFEIMPLSHAHVEDYVKQLLPAHMQAELLERLSFELEPFTTPLLLSMLAAISTQFGKLPLSADTALETAIDALLVRHDMTKPGFVRSTALTPRDLRVLLEEIALAMTLRRAIEVSRAEFEKLVKTLAVQGHLLQPRLPEIVRESIDSGLIQVSDDGVRFIHRAVRDHLAASAAARRAPHDALTAAQAIRRLLRANLSVELVQKIAKRWAVSLSSGEELLAMLRNGFGDHEATPGLEDVIAPLAIYVKELRQTQRDQLLG